jgi:hypothetical protein
VGPEQPPLQQRGDLNGRRAWQYARGRRRAEMFILTCAKPTLPRFLAGRAAFEGNSGRDSCRSSNKPRQQLT